MLYCCEIWGNCAKKYLHEMLIIQKRTIRFICKQDFRAHTVPLFKTLQILLVDNLVMHRLCVLCHELTHDIGPPVLKKFYQNFTLHNYNTRSANNLLVCQVKTNYKKNSFMYQGPTRWNSLPINIKELNNIQKFKFVLKNYLLSTL